MNSLQNLSKFVHSKDGVIKIWSHDSLLMTEIMLDDSLTSLAFLNHLGDLVIGFQKHVFFIDHSKGDYYCFIYKMYFHHNHFTFLTITIMILKMTPSKSYRS